MRYGQLRVIDPSLGSQLPNSGGLNPAGTCLSDESTITWNQQGPTGPQGATGAQGSPGAGGAQGSPGANGQEVLLPAVQFGFDNSAGRMFLKLDGVQGESADHKHKGQILIESFSFGGGNTQAHGGGGGAGKTSFSSFTITKSVDKASPQLQLGAISGKHYKEADVFFARKAGKEQQDFLELKLEGVLISSYKLGGGGGGGNVIPNETIKLDGVKGEATFISGNKQSKILLKPQGGA
jgi:type VI secretion system secreted protein Hcp